VDIIDTILTAHYFSEKNFARLIKSFNNRSIDFFNFISNTKYFEYAAKKITLQDDGIGVGFRNAG